MPLTRSPTAWRRWLALELRRLREEAGLSQKDVAKALRCNVSKVSYIENAQRPVVPRDLDEVLLPLYGVPKERWGQYLAAARDARNVRWWESYSEEGALSASGDLYVGLEQGAARLRAFEPQLVPGLIQIPDYTRAVLRRISQYDDERIESAVELRVRRQGALTRSEGALELWAVLDEAALRRLVGGPETMRAQVQHLINVAALPNVTLQLIPLSMGAHQGMAGGLKILEFAWPEAVDRGVVSLEHNIPPSALIDDRGEVERYISVFERLSAFGRGPDDTLADLATIIKEYE